jgi:ribose transport system ATP-binding protein
MVPDPADPVERLSGGNQQKVVLAKLLATQPDVLMMFDSTRGVDVGTKAEIYSVLRELAAQGSGVLWYSTDNDELINMCDRVLVMRQGQIEAALAGNMITEENLVRAAVGEAVLDTETQAENDVGSAAPQAQGTQTSKSQNPDEPATKEVGGTQNV